MDRKPLFNRRLLLQATASRTVGEACYNLTVRRSLDV
jgi:hypothetical protein